MKTEIDHLVFEVTHQCNYTCKFCYNHWKANDITVDYTPGFTDLKATLVQLFKQVKVRHLAFTGGEPLLQKRLPELLLYCRMQGCKVTLLTNGFFVNNDLIEDVKTIGIHGIQVPLLSHLEVVHDGLTQFIGSWKKSVRAISQLRKANLPVSAIVVVTARNIEDIPATFSLIKELGVDRILLNRFNIGGLGLKFKNELWLYPQQVKRLFHLANDAAREFNLTVSSGVCTPICLVNPADYPNIRFSFCNTDITKRPLTIDYVGNVRFCNHSPENIGNIFETSFEQIVRNDQLIYQKVVPGLCKNCQHFSLCNAGCRAAAQQTGSGFSFADPVLTHLNR
jgi:radical SAM protein with 4Fe4S-binding SPASM domain